MRAIVRDRYGSPDVLELREIELPEPGDAEVLVRVEAASVNTADLDHLRGLPPAARLGTGLRRPRNRRVGLDVVGRVEAVGSNVTRLRPGDAVWADLFSYGHGSFAEYVCAPEDAFAPRPAGISFEAAAAVPHSGILALQGLRGKGRVEPGQKVLINGAGGCVGPFAVQIAKAFGAEVTGVDRPGKLELVGSAGADHVIDYTREDFTENGRRYDLILDIAARGSIRRYRRALAPGGRYVQIARSLAGFFQAIVVGAWLSRTGDRKMGVFRWQPNRSQDLKYLRGLLEAGTITPLIDSRFELGEVPDALRHVEAGRARGKVVITVSGR